jgi:hypothetical protein
MESPNALRWRFGALAFRSTSGCCRDKVERKFPHRSGENSDGRHCFCPSPARKRRGVRADRRRVGRITGVLAGSVIDHALSRRYCLLSEDRSKTEPTTAILAKLFPAR